MLSFGFDRLRQTGDVGARKKTNNEWFETQDAISYWEDFSRPKIVYPNMTKFLPFFYDNKGFLTNQKCFIITGEHVEYLTAYFNSSLFKFCFRDDFPELQGGTRELSKVFFDKIPVLEIDKNQNEIFQDLILKVQECVENGISTKEIEIHIDDLIFDLYELSDEEKETIGFIEIR